MQAGPKVALVMGSDSDFEKLKPCIKRLKSFGIDVVTRVISAHRTPYEAENFAKNAQADGIEVIIGAAGKAAHLAGVLAAFTTLPVIGIPIKSSTMGWDRLAVVDGADAKRNSGRDDCDRRQRQCRDFSGADAVD